MNLIKRQPLDTPADETTVTAAPGRAQTQLTARPGDRFGRYKILEEIGQGGCGAVFVAEQEEPVRRRVALKVIKLGMDTRQVVARFEAERQALAMMDHPNIARVLDAGATDTGRPFFVMELVRGIKITDYCDQNKLSTSARLRLFIQVCQAVQHAHQKGIIHRDLKPSNILVALQDGVPVPKVIDFGIAKATADQKLTDKTVYTAFEQFIGTPAYMSPEQAEMSALDIDTRSDIYSLGVLLYELLIGETPFTSEELLGVGLDAMRHILREKDPARPSTRLSTKTHADLTAIALHRQSEPPQLIKSVRGDLDWIVMKCLEKDRTRRYETANGLAMDIERHLANEPVVARPPSELYRIRKLIRRNKLAFAAAGAVAFALMAGLVVSIWMYLGERQARQVAVRAEQEQNRARAQAATEAARSQQVARFLEDMLNGVGPSVAQGSDTKLLREILDKTAERVGRDLTNQPSVEVELRGTLGRVYNALSEYGEAETMLSAAVTRCRTLSPGNETELATLLDDLGMVLWREGKEANARKSEQEAVELRRKSTDADGRRALALTLNSLATVTVDHNTARAEAALREALGIQEKLLDEKDPARLATMRNLAYVLYRYYGELNVDKGTKRTEADAILRKVVAVERTLPDQAPELAATLNLLGRYQIGNDDVEAESVLREALEIRRKIYPKDNADLAQSLSNLGELLWDEGNSDESEKYLGEAVAMERRLFPNGSRELARNLTDLGEHQQNKAKLGEAEAAFRDALAMRRTLLGETNISTAISMVDLGSVSVEQGKLAEAEPLLREAIAIFATIGQRGYLGFGARPLGSILLQEKRYAEFDALYKKESEGASAGFLQAWAWDLATSDRPELCNGAAAVYLAEAAVMKTDRKDPHVLDTLAAAYAEAGQFTNAVRVDKEAIALETNEAWREYYGDHLKLFEANTPYHDLGRRLADRGHALLESGHFAEAEPVLRDCLDIREKQMPDNWLTFNARSMLGGSLLGQKRFAEAEPLLLSGYEGMIQRRSSIPANGLIRPREALERLVQLYEQTARPDRAAEYKKQLAELDKPQK